MIQLHFGQDIMIFEFLPVHGVTILSCCKTMLNVNPPTAFWGLLGPQKDVNGNFTKTVSKQTTIF